VKNIEDSKYTLSACTFTAFSISSKVTYPGNKDADEASYGCNIPSGYNTALTRGECISERGSGQNCLGQVIGAGPVCANGASNYPVCDAAPVGFCWLTITDLSGAGWHLEAGSDYFPGSFLLAEGDTYNHAPSGIGISC
jgi:hypothetical protein